MDTPKLSLEALPSLEDVQTLTGDQRAAFLTQLEAAMQTEGGDLRLLNTTVDTYDAQYNAAYETFKKQHEPLMEARKRASERRDAAKGRLQQMAVIRRLLTGDATWQAFQAAEEKKAQYDEGAMFNWAMLTAPPAVRDSLVQLNPKAVSKLVLERADDSGVPKPYEGCEPMPALVIPVYTGRVLSQKLADLPAPEKPAEPAAHAAAALTVDFVREAIERKSEPTPDAPF